MELSKYAKNVWETQLDQKIVYVHATADWSECYQTDAAHVVELDNGKFVFISESGCSCYSYDDADLTVVDSLSEAMNLYNNIVNQQENV